MVTRSLFTAVALVAMMIYGGIAGADTKSSNGIKQLLYVQPVDHFEYGVASVTSFQQRYYVDDRYWTGPKANVGLLNVAGNVGLLNECAPHFGALVVYIEHRFYGKSVPFGSIDLAMADSNIRGCLTTEQSLADFAVIILTVQTNLSATTSTVIVVGGSYVGLLAAWFRLKYPHIADGALASSAPILAFDSVTPEGAACAVVSKDFQELDKNCYNKIHHSWAIIDDIASKQDGMRYLSRAFNTCRPLQSSNTLKTYLSDLYTKAAQYNGRFNSFISSICDAIRGENDPIKGIAKAVSKVVGTESCLKMSTTNNGHAPTLDLNSLKH